VILPLTLAALIALASALAPEAGAQGTAAPDPSGDPGPSAAPEPSVSIDPAAPVVAVVLDREDAEPGDTVTATVSVTNPGPDPLLLPCAAPVTVWADISDVVEGPKQDWATTDPWRRGMRRQLLGDPVGTGTGPLAIGMAPTTKPDCPEPTRSLAPGETLVAEHAWRVGYADGTPLYGPAGDPAVIRARVVPQRSETQIAAGEEARIPVAAEASVRVASARNRRAISPSRAIEALFNDREAAAWLDLEHGSTWRRADLRLSRGRWLFDVRRIATGCCRESLSASVDAVDGSVRNVDAQTLDWTPARTVIEPWGDLELRLDLQRRRFPDGRASRIRMTVTNLAEEDGIWFWSHDNTCIDQPGIWITVGRERVGQGWPGQLGAFKRRALKGDLVLAPAGPPRAHTCRAPRPVYLAPEGGSVTTESFFRPGIVPAGQRSLRALGRIELVGPTSDSVRRWRVYASPEVRAKFRTGKGSQQIDSPAALIDAALSQKAFARQIRRTPRSRWKAAGVTGRTVWLELKNGSRIVAIVP
jgi:hypothetical protein